MDNRFDELSKGLAQCVTRRATAGRIRAGGWWIATPSPASFSGESAGEIETENTINQLKGKL